MVADIRTSLDLNSDGTINLGEINRATELNLGGAIASLPGDVKKQILEENKDRPPLAEEATNFKKETGITITKEALEKLREIEDTALRQTISKEPFDTVSPAPTGPNNNNAATAHGGNTARDLSAERLAENKEERKEKGNEKSLGEKFIEMILSFLGINQEDKEHIKTDVMAKSAGSSIVAQNQVTDTVQRVTGNDISKNDINKLDLNLLNECRNIGNCGVKPSQDHSITFPGTAKPQEITGGITV